MWQQFTVLTRQSQRTKPKPDTFIADRQVCRYHIQSDQNQARITWIVLLRTVGLARVRLPLPGSQHILDLTLS